MERVRWAPDQVASDSLDLHNARTAAAPHRTSTETDRASDNKGDEADLVYEYVNRLVRRLSRHLQQEAPQTANGSALALLRYLNHQLTEVLSDVRETCFHLERLTRGELSAPPQVRGPGTASLREFRHSLRELRVRLAAIASGDTAAAENGHGLLAPELAQLGSVLASRTNPTQDERDALFEEERAVRIKARGTMDALSLSATLDALEEATADSAVVLLDLSDISYADSSGISLIRRYAKKLEEQGGSLLLVGVQDAVKETLEHLGLMGELQCFSTIEEAQRALQEAGRDRHPGRGGLADVSARALAAALLR